MNTTESSQPGFSIAPEALDSINMRFTTNKLTLTMVNSKMLFISKIDKAIIASPAVSMNDTL
jgi:hypothetical protein